MFSSFILRGTEPGDLGDGEVVDGRLRLPGLERGMSVVTGAEGAGKKINKYWHSVLYSGSFISLLPGTALFCLNNMFVNLKVIFNIME